MRRRLRFVLLRSITFAVMVGMCALGCSGSGKLNPVTGKVMYKSQPLAGALVTFHPKGSKDFKTERPTGLTKEDGTFSISTGKNEGAPEGEYVVTIICSQTPGNAGKKISTGGMETVDVLKGAYSGVENSRLLVTVKSGSNQLEPFDLK